MRVRTTRLIYDTIYVKREASAASVQTPSCRIARSDKTMQDSLAHCAAAAAAASKAAAELLGQP